MIFWRKCNRFDNISAEHCCNMLILRLLKRKNKAKEDFRTPYALRTKVINSGERLGALALFRFCICCAPDVEIRAFHRTAWEGSRQIIKDRAVITTRERRNILQAQSVSLSLVNPFMHSKSHAVPSKAAASRYR